MSASYESWQMTSIRVCLGLFFLVLGGEKFFRFDEFYEDISNYELLPPPAILLSTYLIPSIELIAGLSVLFRWHYTGALLLLLLLLIAFIFALGWAWSQGLEISCGCSPWSAQETTNYPLGIGMNIALVTASFTLLIKELKLKAP